MQAVTLSFSQILDPATVNSSTLMFMNGWNSNMAISGTYSVNGNAVTFTPTTPYPAGAHIYVGACNGPTDVLGESISGCWSQSLWDFYVSGTTDTTAFYIDSVSPLNGASNVGRDQTISVTFNKSIDPSSITSNPNNAVVYAGQDVQDRGSFTLSSDNRTLYFNIGSLLGGTTYTVSLPAGGVSDMSGNHLNADSNGDPLTGPYISTFTTMSDPATDHGSVQGENPGNKTQRARQLDADALHEPSGQPVDGDGERDRVYQRRGRHDRNGGARSRKLRDPVHAIGRNIPERGHCAVVAHLERDGYLRRQLYRRQRPLLHRGGSQRPACRSVSPACCNTQTMPTNGEVDVQFNLPIDPSTATTSASSRNWAVNRLHGHSHSES